MALAKSVRRTDTQNLFKNLKLIAEAIDREKRIEFSYNEYGIDKKLHPVFEEKIIFDPYSLYINDNYFVIGFSEEAKAFVSYRVDLITDLYASVEPQKNKKGSFEVGRHVAEHPYSYVGTPERIVFLTDKRAVNDLIDAFPDYRFDRNEGDRALVSVNANLADAEAFCKRFGEFVEAVYPQKLRNRLQSFAESVHSIYMEKESDRYYKEISTAKNMIEKNEYASLDLINIDLNKKEEHLGLTKVKSVVLSDNKISDVSFLKNYKKLESLRIENDPVSDLSFLAASKSLKSLSLCGTKLSDASFLKSNENLTDLELIDNEIKVFSFIYDLFYLRSLNINLASVLTLDLKKLKESCPFLRITVPEISDIRSNVDRLLSYDEWIEHGIEKVEQLFEAFVEKPEVKKDAAFSKEDINKAFDFFKGKDRVALFDFRRAVRLSRPKEDELFKWLIDCGKISKDEGGYLICLPCDN